MASTLDNDHDADANYECDVDLSSEHVGITVHI